MGTGASRKLLGYLLSVIAVGGALALTRWLEPWLAGTVLPPTFAAITVVALMAGLGPALIALVLGAVGLKLLFLPSTASLLAWDTASVVRLGLFLSLALPLVLLGSAQRKANRRLASAYDRARVALQQRDQLLAIVSHDLRGAIATLVLQLEAVARFGDRGGRLARVQRHISSMTRLIDDLLALTSFEAGHLALANARAGAEELAREALERVEPLAEARGVILAEDFAPTDDIWCDTERVLQTLTNLLLNAIKFSPEGGTISVCTRQGTEGVYFAIHDTGPGIAADQLPFVFERYWRAPGDQKGTGLGLFIARAIVEAHRGRIWVESRPGEGTTVTFVLPVHARGARAGSGHEYRRSRRCPAAT